MEEISEEKLILRPLKVNGKVGYIDKTGRFVINLQFDRASNFYEGLALVTISEKNGYIDKTGRFIAMGEKF
jgi:hypothetical protein